MNNYFSGILARIMGYSELAIMNQTDGNEEKIADYLQTVIEASELARELILQTITHNEQGGGDTQATSLLSIVENVIEVVSATLTDGHSIVKQLNDNLAKIKINPVQLQQALLLMLTSIRDTQDGGAITIELSTNSYEDEICSCCKQTITGNFVELVLHSNGENLSESDRQQLFNNSLVSQPERLNHKGLAAVHRVLHEHSGHVLVKESHPAGTTFSLLFVAMEEDKKKSADKKASIVTKLRPSDRKNINN